MNSLQISLFARRLVPMLAMAFVLLALNGCGGKEDPVADTPDTGEHEEVESNTPKGDYDSDEHAESENDEAGHDEAEEEGHELGHGEEAEFTEPHNYAEAVHVIYSQLEKIEALMAAGKLDKVHAEAAVIRDVSKTLSKFALATDSGVPQEAVREINLAARALAATFEPIDEAGDSGDLAGTQKVYAEMIELYETLEQYADHEEEGGHEEDDGHNEDDGG